MARLPKVKLRAIPVFPTNVTGATGINIAKVNGIWTITLDVSDFNISSVAEANRETTYAISWGSVTDDNPEGAFQLAPFSGFQGLSDDLTSLAELNTTGIVARAGSADFVTRTITGTANRITITNGGGIAGDPTADISTSYVGQATITTLGTVSTGTWSATAIAANKGGTGATSYAVGDLLYADTTSTLAKLADIATGNALISGGVGVAPAWGKIGISTHVSGLGTNVATALGVNVGTAGALVTFNGALGTPSSGVATNLTGTASGLTAGNVTTNANLTGDVTSVGNATTLAAGNAGNLNSGTLLAARMPALTGDITTSAGAVATTLATVNSNVGPFGSAAQSVQFTVNGKGLLTAAANVTITPAIGSITGLGTGVGTALAIAVGSAGGPVTFNGAGGTPSSITLTNASGTAASLTAGNVTTNANLTGAVTSVGNAASLGSFSSANLATALTDETGSGAAVFGTSPVLNTADARGVWTAGATWTLPAHTLGGTVSGGGNQINNVIIGNSTPLAGTFTTLASTSAAVTNNVSAGTFDNVVITAPASTATLTIGSGKTFTASNTVTITATDGVTLGWGPWTDYTPTLTAGTGSFTSASANGRYKQRDKDVFFVANAVIVTNGSAGARIEMTLPVTANAQIALSGINATTGAGLSAGILSAISLTKVVIFATSSGYPGADGQTFTVSGRYEST